MENALKAISSTDDELRVGNYIVLFGGRDLEGVASDNKNADGSLGEFFTADTQLESRYTKAGRLPVDWEHNAKPDGEGFDPDVLGYVDWKTAEQRDLGVWVERVLNRRNAYMSYLEELIGAGLIGTSSEASGIEKGDDGAIKTWPLVADTFTVSPMEPRMMNANVLQAAKALGLLTDQPEPEGAPEGEVIAGAPVTATTEGNESTTEEDEMTEEVTQVTNVSMTPEALAELVEGAVGKAVEAFKAAQPAPSAGFVTQDGLDNQASDPELTPYKSLGEQLQDVAKAYAPGARPSARLLKTHKAVSGHSEGVAADGGFAVEQALQLRSQCCPVRWPAVTLLGHHSLQ